MSLNVLFSQNKFHWIRSYEANLTSYIEVISLTWQKRFWTRLVLHIHECNPTHFYCYKTFLSLLFFAHSAFHYPSNAYSLFKIDSRIHLLCKVSTMKASIASSMPTLSAAPIIAERWYFSFVLWSILLHVYCTGFIIV